MSVNCTICSDALKSEDIYATDCGHVFHYKCITDWLERSNTCPQCRKQTKRSAVSRLFLTINETDTKHPASSSSSMDSETMIENLRFQVNLANKNLNIYLAECAKLKKQKRGLVAHVQKLESEITQKKLEISKYKGQIKDLQEQNEGYKKAKDEATRWKRKHEELKSVLTLIDAPLEDVQDVIDRNLNPIMSRKYIFALKKTMTSQEMKIKKLSASLKNLQDDFIQIQMGKDCLPRRQNSNPLTHNNSSPLLQQKYNKTAERFNDSPETSNLGVRENIQDISKEIFEQNTSKLCTENIGVNSSINSIKFGNSSKSLSSKVYKLPAADDFKTDYIYINSSSDEQEKLIQDRRKGKKRKCKEYEIQSNADPI